MANRGESMTDVILRWFSFIPAGLAVWVLYDLLMLVLGGKNTTYGLGWGQWNYVRWMLAPDDVAYRVGAGRVLFFFLLLPAVWGAVNADLLPTTACSSRRRWLAMLSLALFCQSLGLLVMFSPHGGFRFWWATPRTVVPSMTIRFFEVSTVIVWFASPFLVHWLITLVVRLFSNRHRLPLDGGAPDESS